MQTKEFTQYRYVKPFPFEPFQDQKDLCKMNFFFFTGNPSVSPMFQLPFFEAVVVGVFPEKR